jgi:LAS superfamily LD-carboxypeptidase LdcB
LISIASHSTNMNPPAPGRVVVAVMLVLSGLVVNARAAEEWVLLISRPQLWSAPSKEAPSTPQDWAAGRRLGLIGRQGNDPKVKRGGWLQARAGKVKGWLPEAYLAPPPMPPEPKSLESIGTETVDRGRGLPPEYVPADLVPVGPRHEENVNPQLRRAAAEAFKSLVGAARAEGIKLFVVSAYRPWAKQQELYERRVREDGWDQQTVAKPGHSEHQLGTAVDLTDGNEETLLKESFSQTKTGRWLHDHAWAYGFAISYTRHNQPQTGYAPEPWHYRYWGIAQARTKHLKALGEKEK